MLSVQLVMSLMFVHTRIPLREPCRLPHTRCGDMLRLCRAVNLTKMQLNGECCGPHANRDRQTLVCCSANLLIRGSQVCASGHRRGSCQLGLLHCGFRYTMVEQILDNLTLKINKVHMRYEDDKTCPRAPFAAGISMAGLSVTSTDVQWRATFVQQQQVSCSTQLRWAH